MSDFLQAVSNLPPDQEAIRAKCFHPTGKFVEFAKDEINQSIPERFETMARLHPHRVAVQSSDGDFVEFAKDEINQSIPERFETMARLHPHRLAVQSSDCALSYEA